MAFAVLITEVEAAAIDIEGSLSDVHRKGAFPKNSRRRFDAIAGVRFHGDDRMSMDSGGLGTGSNSLADPVCV